METLQVVIAIHPHTEVWGFLFFTNKNYHYYVIYKVKEIFIMYIKLILKMNYQHHPLLTSHSMYIQAVVDFYDHYRENYVYLIRKNIYLVLLSVIIWQNSSILVNYYILNDQITMAWISIVIAISIIILQKYRSHKI